MSPPLEGFTEKVLLEIQDELQLVNRDITEQESLRVSLTREISEATAERIRILPVAVQKEHEAVATEIADLNWHLTRANRKLNQVAMKNERCEMIFKRLTESISTIDKHAPMVEDKLKLEQKEMLAIEQKQEDADKTYKKTKQELEVVEADFRQKTNKLDQIRCYHENQLASKRETLAVLRRDLQMNQNEYREFLTNTEIMENTLKEFEETAEELANAAEAAHEEEAKLTETLAGYKKEIIELDEIYEKASQKKQDILKSIESETNSNNASLRSLRDQTKRI